MALKNLGYCARLDDNAKRCRKKATVKGSYHGDNEIYFSFEDDSVRWVEVCLCDLHAKAAKIIQDKE